MGSPRRAAFTLSRQTCAQRRSRTVYLCLQGAVEVVASAMRGGNMRVSLKSGLR